MSRRLTRSTSGIVSPQKAAAEERLSPSASAGATNGSVKRKKGSAVEDFAQDSERPQRTTKRSKRENPRVSRSNASGQNGSSALSAPGGDSPVGAHTQESSVSVTKKTVTSRTKGGDISTNATREKKVEDATSKRASKTENTEENVKEEDEKEEVTVRKQNSTKGKKKKDKATEEMPPLAIRTTGLKMFIGAHVSAAQGSFDIPFLPFDPTFPILY